MLSHLSYECRFRRRVSGGFTLIELLVVMTIIALLLAIAAPRYTSSLERSKEVALEENLKVMRVSLDRFFGDKGRYPVDLNELVQEKYLRAVPIDPMTEANDTWITVADLQAATPGVMDVKSGASGSMRDGRRYDEL